MWAATVAAQSGPSIGFVSRERIIRESSVAKRLGAAENAITQQLQSSVDSARQALDAEEADLARLRGELSPEEFERRATAFDKRIRAVRQSTQERATVIQRQFQEARARLVGALPPVLEQLRLEAGLDIILGSDQVLAADVALDLTERAIDLLNAEVDAFAVPVFDFSEPLLPPLSSDTETQEQQ